MTKVRPVQLSAFPDIQPDKPIGPILPSVFQGTNADLIAAIAPYYLTGSVCDLTYGEGNWWTRYQPDPFTAHDKYKLDGVDFTALPEPDNTYDTVCFDPPYIPQGGTDHAPDFVDRFGLVQRPQLELWDMIAAGINEAARVTRDVVLIKCMDFVNSGRFHAWSIDVAMEARRAGLDVHDIIIHHTGSGPGGHNIFDPKRARRHHSYLLIFRQGRT
jgi:hypothetical protein